MNKEMNEVMRNDILALTKPIFIDDKEIKELAYNFEDMTAKDKINIGKYIKNRGIAVSVEELDADYHFFLFAGAVVKANPSYDISDLLRLNARDAQKGATAARDFFYRNLED